MTVIIQPQGWLPGQARFKREQHKDCVRSPGGRSDWKANDGVLDMVATIVDENPQELGYLPSRWSSELLALELLLDAAVLRCMPPRYGAGWQGLSSVTDEPVRPCTGATREKRCG